MRLLRPLGVWVRFFLSQPQHHATEYRQCKYKILAATGCTVPEALRLAMLRLARRFPAGYTAMPEVDDDEDFEGARCTPESEWLGGFRKVEVGGSRDAGGSGVVEVVREFLDILEGVSSSDSSRARPCARSRPSSRSSSSGLSLLAQMAVAIAAPTGWADTQPASVHSTPESARRPAGIMAARCAAWRSTSIG